MATQARWRIELTAFPGTTLGVSDATIREGVSAPYSARVDAHIADPDADVELALGSDCVITIERPDLGTRRFVGIVREVCAMNADVPGTTAMRLEVVPALALLALRRDTRIFQDKSAPEVLEVVLGEALAPYGRKMRLECAETHAPRDYLLQYQETDLDFAHRLMEEAGISYAFEHEGGTEVLVLRDASRTYPELESATGSTLSFDPHVHEAAGSENVFAARRCLNSTIGRASARGYDFRSMLRVDGSAEDAGGEPERETYAHRRGRLLRVGADAKRAASHILAAERARALELRGSGRAIALSAGRRFDLSGHPSPGFDAQYLVIEVEHRFLGGDHDEATMPRDGYVHRFVAIPAEVPFRSRRATPKPEIGSIETAVVVGPAGEEIHTDEHARVKVQFHWDREGERDEHSSCWLRTRQSWAGPGWGFLFIPRIGMEVVVQFLEGDPDRPVVAGCLYNAANLPPYDLPAEKTKSTIKSASSPGGGGFNELRYEDLKGNEQVYIHAQKNLDEAILNNHATSVGYDQHNSVKGNQTQKIGVDQTEKVDVNQKMTVNANRTVHVKGAFTETVGGGEERLVLSGVTETIDGSETRLTTGGLDETRVGAELKAVIAGLTEVSLGDLTQTVVGDATEVVTGALTEVAVGGVSVVTSAAAKYDASGPTVATVGGGLTLLCPPSLQWNTALRLEIDGMDTKVGVFDFGVTAVNNGITGLAVGLTGVGIDLTLSKSEAWGMTVGQTGVAISLVGLELGVAGVALSIGAFEAELKGLIARI